MKPVEGSHGYYQVLKMESIEDVWGVFPDDKADEMNWLFAGTNGIHAHGLNIDDLLGGEHQAELREEVEKGEGDGQMTISLLILKPRICQLVYGCVPVTRDDLMRIRKIVTSTIKAIGFSQRGSSNIVSVTEEPSYPQFTISQQSKAYAVSRGWQVSPEDEE